MKLIYAKKSYVSSLEKEMDEERACQLLLCGQLNHSCHEELGEYGTEDG